MAFGPDENLVNHQDLWDYHQPLSLRSYILKLFFACIGALSVSPTTLKVYTNDELCRPSLSFHNHCWLTILIDLTPQYRFDLFRRDFLTVYPLFSYDQSKTETWKHASKSLSKVGTQGFHLSLAMKTP